jgi:2-succinyl-5-enolpyruvyl-6-hydroxy-3-cyclohexene-1-carboxylate synthase
MGLGDTSLACTTALVDALADAGVHHACLSPGSRSTPLALALSRDERITLHVHLDERSAAFFAIGVAKATGEPVAVACTSGTAAAEYFPAIVEAAQSRTPLVVLTADRPPRLRGTGANQTIDQTELYGRYARAYLEPPVPAGDSDVLAWADTGRRAVEAALGEPAGPVHVNCPFEEPLVPDGGPQPLVPRQPMVPRQAIPVPEPDVDGAREALRAFASAYAGRRGVLAVGSLRSPETLSLLSLGSVLGWPVLAEPLSGLRLDASDAGRALAAGQLLIGDEGWLARHRPEIVVQVGAAPTTRATQRMVADVESLVVLDRTHLDPDPEGRAEHRIRVEPELFAAIAWSEREALGIPAADPSWPDAWRTADLVARAHLDRRLDGWDEPFEGRVARDVASFVPHGGTLIVGSSTPVRDLDVFMTPRRPPRIWTAPDLIRVVANRGASGIDGLVATALGAAVTGRPTYALLGDLSFLYDAGSLLWSAKLGVDVVFVVVANGGGQIFSMLEHATLPEHEALFLTPHPAAVADVCAAAGAGHALVTRAAELTPTLERAAHAGGVQVVEVEIDADRDRQRRHELRETVGAALRDR